MYGRSYSPAPSDVALCGEFRRSGAVPAGDVVDLRSAGRYNRAGPVRCIGRTLWSPSLGSQAHGSGRNHDGRRMGGNSCCTLPFPRPLGGQSGVWRGANLRARSGRWARTGHVYHSWIGTFVACGTRRKNDKGPAKPERHFVVKSPGSLRVHARAPADGFACWWRDFWGARAPGVP